MNADSDLAVFAAVDFGGTRIRSAIVLPDGTVEGWNTTQTPRGQGPSAVLERVIDSVETSIE